MSVVLAVKVDTESHTEDNIAYCITKRLCQCEIPSELGTRLDSINTDNGANFRVAVNQLAEQDIIEKDPCACHSPGIKKCNRP